MWKGIYIKNHFWLLILCHSRVLLRESLEVRSEASLTLYSLAGHHLSCPWLQWHPSLSVAGIRTSSEFCKGREELLWAHTGLSSAAQEVAAMKAAHVEKVASDQRERNGDFTAVSLVAVRTCSAASAWACMGGHFALAQLPWVETDSRAASSARCFLLPAELCKENRHLGFDVSQILLPYKRYRVPEAMVRIKYPHSSSLLSKNLRTTSYDRTPDNQTQDTHKIMYF